MSHGERAIREVIRNWLAASKAGDLATVLSLMDDEVVFLVAGQKPFGKEELAASFKRMKDVRFEGVSEVQEVEVCGDRAWCRAHLKVTTVHAGGNSMRRSGHTLSIFRKKPDGAWVLFRDANLLTAE